MSLRAIPRLMTFRPADANEVSEMWRVVMPHETAAGADGVDAARRCRPSIAPSTLRRRVLRKGAYILADSGGTPEVILMGTGSEVQLCVDAYEKLTAEGVKARVVSMPCLELFEDQPEEYKLKVLPPEVSARRGRGRYDVRMEGVCRLGRNRRRPRGLRSVGADQGTDEALRLHGGNVVAKARETMKKAKG